MLISIILVTLNSEAFLPGLLKSLEAQTDKDFELVVFDGESTDSTLEILSIPRNFPINFVSQFEKSQTDATNRAIDMSKGDYFVIVGCDDFLAVDAISNFKLEIKNFPVDLLVAKVMINNKINHYRSPRLSWIHGSQSVAGSFAVGLCIRKSFFYSVGKFPTRLFPIKSDEYFMLKALKLKPTIHHCDFISGEFTSSGISNKNLIFSLTEIFCARVITGHSVTLQLILFNLRVIKWIFINKNKLINPSHHDL
jgi:glycosyltransferase involved in cell wall biosynthesis